MSIRKIKKLRKRGSLTKKKLNYLRALYNKQFASDGIHRSQLGRSNILAYEKEGNIYPFLLGFWIEIL